MSFLRSVLSLPAGQLLPLAAVVGVLVVLWISALLSRRHFITIKRSEETELIAFELRRIADAVERLSVARESQSQSHTPVETGSGRSIGMSMFGR